MSKLSFPIMHGIKTWNRDRESLEKSVFQPVASEAVTVEIMLSNCGRRNSAIYTIISVEIWKNISRYNVTSNSEQHEMQIMILCYNKAVHYVNK